MLPHSDPTRLKLPIFAVSHCVRSSSSRLSKGDASNFALRFVGSTRVCFSVNNRWSSTNWRRGNIGEQFCHLRNRGRSIASRVMDSVLQSERRRFPSTSRFFDGQFRVLTQPRRVPTCRTMLWAAPSLRYFKRNATHGPSNVRRTVRSCSSARTRAKVVGEWKAVRTIDRGIGYIALATRYADLGADRHVSFSAPVTFSSFDLTED